MSMETLDPSWDVILAGTGLQPALLALALSRSGKKILHLDKNDYYGGREAALRVSEAEEWAKHLDAHDGSSSFRNISIDMPDTVSGGAKLASPGSYSLSLSPALLYTRSALLPALVSSKAHEQLEFLAIGNWFVWRLSASNATPTEADQAGQSSGPADGSLVRVPNSREDIFSDVSLTSRVKSALGKFLRLVVVYQDEDMKEIWEPYRDAPFADLLSKQFKISSEYHGTLLAWTMSNRPREQIETESALRSIHRHLTSMGIFGAGISAVLPKYGGLFEVVQVACRAAAVGGATYVLNRKIDAIEAAAESDDDPHDQHVLVSLQGGDVVRARYVFATDDQIPASSTFEPRTRGTVCSRSTLIIGSKLSSLFLASTEGGPQPSAAVVVFPAGSLVTEASEKNDYPVHVLIHSGDTGECPSGQCVVYASTMQPLGQASHVLDIAIRRLLSSIDAATPPPLLWSMKYEVQSTSLPPTVVQDSGLAGLHRFVEPPVDTVFDDRTLASVREAWKTITGDADENFMKFSDRNAATDTDPARDDDNDE